MALGCGSSPAVVWWRLHQRTVRLGPERSRGIRGFRVVCERHAGRRLRPYSSALRGNVHGYTPAIDAHIDKVCVAGNVALVEGHNGGRLSRSGGGTRTIDRRVLDGTPPRDVVLADQRSGWRKRVNATVSTVEPGATQAYGPRQHTATARISAPSLPFNVRREPR